MERNEERRGGSMREKGRRERERERKRERERERECVCTSFLSKFGGNKIAKVR